MTNAKYTRLVFFSAAVVATATLSPKWLLSPMAWFAPALVLLLIDGVRPWKGFFVAWLALFLAGLVGNYKVFPFPVPLFLLLTLQTSLVGAVPYALAVWIGRRIHSWTTVFIFPALAVITEYLNSFSGGGTLGSIAYTQSENIALIQVVSVTGIWGISFLVYFSSSVIYRVVQNRKAEVSSLKPVGVFLSLFILIHLFGAIRTNSFFNNPESTIGVAGISDTNIEPLLTVYAETFGTSLDVDPARLTQSSPELHELNKALTRFIEQPLAHEYAGSRRAMTLFHDKIFSQAQREVDGGARIIAMSEALMFTIKPIEDSLIAKGMAFARRNRVRILLSVGSFIPGKVTAGSKYIENKAVMINEQGLVDYVFYKNKPVPMVEGSVPGNGDIPVIETGYGAIATSICYDADFPALMRKAGQKKADLLLLPSGDWKEISPFHANVARLRAVENGVSLVRPVSGAESIVCDQFGRVIARNNFFDNGSKTIRAQVPMRGLRTVYTQVGDWLPLTCVGYVLILVLVILVRRLRRSRTVSHGVADLG